MPIWYQKRFVAPGSKSNELWYLDLEARNQPGYSARFQTRPGLHRWGPKHCFVEDDLYTQFVGGAPETAIEQAFFGEIDRAGQRAVEAYGAFNFQPDAMERWRALLTYIGTQKLRTPKGISWLSEESKSTHNDVLNVLTRLRQLFDATWMECVWQIADASESETKFILSDHPVTVYNRSCGPRSRFCRGDNDPDVRLHGTHILFPLSRDKLLILTNLSWARNPYLNPQGVRPNPSMLRPAMFNFTKIQVGRQLTEHEVQIVNFIVKSRAKRYVASAEQEWLYPERHVSKAEWANFGEGYIFMPDPRGLSYSSTMYAGYDSGRVIALDEFGRPPTDRDFETGGDDYARAAQDRFKGEFARLFGRRYRGRTWAGPDGNGSVRLTAEFEDADLHEMLIEHEREAARRMRQAQSRGKRPS